MSGAGLQVLEGDLDLETLATALREALDGGPAIAPLPTVSAERDQVLAMLRPAEPLEDPQTAAIVATSGSTGRPKGVMLSGAAIRSSVEATHRRLGGPGDWLLALPTHYVAGLMVMARAVVADTAVHQVGADLGGLSSWATDRRGDRPAYLSVVPTQLTRALDDPALVASLAGVDAVLLGGAAASSALLQRAAGAGIRVITTYGMSETCGGCVYDGVPLDGVTLGSDTPGGLDPDAPLQISGPMVFDGYRGQPDLTAQVRPHVGTMITNDRGRWIDGRLAILGRVDDVVISGGINIDLAEVERVARSWPGAAELVIVAVPDAEWGVRVVAVAEGSAPLVGSAAAGPDALRAHLTGQLPTYAAPRQLVWRDRLPRTSSGKIDRQRLLRELSNKPPE